MPQSHERSARRPHSCERVSSCGGQALVDNHILRRTLTFAHQQTAAFGKQTATTDAIADLSIPYDAVFSNFLGRTDCERLKIAATLASIRRHRQRLPAL